MKSYLFKLLNISFLLVFSFQGFGQKRVVKVIYIGDSITYGGWLDDVSTEAPPVFASSYLKKQKGIDSVEFSNQGHSGYTTVNFLPGSNAFTAAEKAVGTFSDKDGLLIFSIMLGTNDSAVKGPRGAPVAPENYKINMKSIVDQLLTDFPKSKIIIHLPLWYSPNTYNGAQYLQEGLDRLQSYSEPIKMLVKEYNNDKVFLGNTSAFDYFRINYLTKLRPEDGRQGTFYLHPNKQGAAELGVFWGQDIYRTILKK